MSALRIPVESEREHAIRLAEAIERLVEMRDDAIDRMLRRGAIEPGHLPIVAGIEATLAVLDEAAIACDEASRAVVSDDGREIRLTLYDEAGAVASVKLDGWRAVRLATSPTP